MLFSKSEKKTFSGQEPCGSKVRPGSKRSWRTLSGRVSRRVSIAGTILGVIIAAVVKTSTSEMPSKKTVEEHRREVTSGNNIVTMQTDDFSIELPDIFKETNMPVVTLDDSNKSDTLKCYSADDITVGICRASYSAEDKSYVDANGTENYAQLIADYLKTYSDSDVSVVSSTRFRGNCVLLKMNVTRKDLFTDTDKVFICGIIWYDKTCTYETDIMCRQADRSKYESSMERWVKSFKVKK